MPTSNFMENYKACCSDSKTRIKVKSMSQNKCLQFNADRIDVEDWVPLTRAIKEDRSLHALIIKSEYPGKKWRCSLIDNVKPPIHKPNVMQELMESITTCMRESSILSSVQLQSLSINKTHIDTLAKGIKECRTLQHLAITRCQLNDIGVKELCNSLRTDTGIQTINLTGCNITKEGARYIADLIRAQRLVRYSETWKQSLRYREPNPEIIPGIRRITLNDNPEIMDEGYALINHELMDDLWIKAIDMQNCGLTNISGELSIQLIETNTTIIVLDIRRNEMINQDTIKSIKTMLINRCNLVPEKQCDHDNMDHNNNYNQIYDWLDGTITSTNRSDICSSRKPNSEFSFKTIKNNNISRINLRKMNELEQAKGITNDTTRNSVVDEKVRLELKEKEKQKEQLADKLVKEWNRRKLIEKERDKLKEELHNYITVTNNINNNYPTRINRLKLSKSLNLHKTLFNPVNSLSALSSPASTISKKSKKRNKKSNNKIKVNTKKIQQNIVNDNSNKDIDHNDIMKTDYKVTSKSDSQLKKLEEKYQNKQNQNEFQNIQENLDKIKIKHLQFDTTKPLFNHVGHNNTNDDKNTDTLENIIKRDYRDLSPTSRSQWILKELMSGNKIRNNKSNVTPSPILSGTKCDNDIIETGDNNTIETKNNFGIDFGQKWDLTVSF